MISSGIEEHLILTTGGVETYPPPKLHIADLSRLVLTIR
jgi:hypothetical protein